MNPIYKFSITATNQGGTETRSGLEPVYGDLSKLIEVESNEYYAREKLDGKLKFVGPDYSWITTKMNQYFDTEFEMVITMSTNGGSSFAEYWRGTFFAADCNFDLDNQIIEVEMDVKDQYNDILLGIENKYNLIKLAPKIQPLKITKRCALQIYEAGSDAVGFFLGGMYWESSATSESDEGRLLNDLHFGQMIHSGVAVISDATPEINGQFRSDTLSSPLTQWSAVRDGYRFEYSWYEHVSGKIWTLYRLYDNSNNDLLYEGFLHGETPRPIAQNVTMGLAPGHSGMPETCHLSITEIRIFGRLVMDVDTYGGQSTFYIPDGDIVEDNRNYRKCYPYTTGTALFYSGRLSDEPTEWGLYKPTTASPDKYYLPPEDYDTSEYYPVARTTWGFFSVWLKASLVGSLSGGDKAYTLRDSFSLGSVISVLLNEFAPDVKFEETADYSDFFYNPNNGWFHNQFRLFLTPKSNILAGEYDSPAQKAEITLKGVFEMLRNCFRCYWFVEKVTTGGVTEKRLRIEHVLYFMRGGTYGNTPTPDRDLTTEFMGRTIKMMSYGTNKFSYENLQMPERYEFGWMDDVSQFFEGWPISITSKYVKSGNIENVNVSNFTSDIDYMLLSPGECDKDGFALLGAFYDDNVWQLRISHTTFGNHDIYAQNAFLSFWYLQWYYMYDMPAKNITATCYNGTVRFTKKQKTQEITFPCPNDPDFVKFVKTGIGNGQIRKISINLSSRNAKATLIFTTEVIQ